MHSTTTTGPRVRRRWVFLTLLAGLMLLALAQSATALAAASFVGGAKAGDYPLYVANDHSVNALRFEATGLTPSTDYNMKVRISPTDSVSGGTSRGFTWNPTTLAWVQERDEWSYMPVITTDENGDYDSGTVWTFFKFGDTTKPAEGASSTWYIVISVQPVSGGSGTTQNSFTAQPVTIIDMTGELSGATGAFRIHNAVTTGGQTAKRIEADASGLEDVWAVSRTENNSVDEGYGTTATGDFDLAVPVGMAFDAKIQNLIWPAAASGFTGSQANVDVALGADDTTPPDAPGGFASSIDGTTAHLSWDAVEDAESYTVYRWQDATPIDDATNYTPQHLPIASVEGATAYDVTGLTEGETYHFEVRAVDDATNVGPPSKYPTGLALETTRPVVNWGGKATLSGHLTDGAEPFADGQQVRLERSYDGSAWTLVEMLDPTSAGAFDYSVTANPQRMTKYRLVFTGDATHWGAESASITVKPRVKLGRPVAPKAVKRARKFAVYGSLVPRHASGSKYVKLKCYKRVSGKWRLKKVVTAADRNYKSYSRYKASFSLTSRGLWKIVARYSATNKYASKTSSAKYLRVK